MLRTGPPNVPWPSNYSFLALLHDFVPAAELGWFAVNIGAQDGKTYDPVYPLFAEGFGGIAFEGAEPYREKLNNHLSG
eukprot:2240334-Prymnesium_polylepis.1